MAFLDILIWTGLILLVAWELAWKGIGMWQAARNEHKAWFICILIFNTIGILPIIYIILQKRK